MAVERSLTDQRKAFSGYAGLEHASGQADDLVGQLGSRNAGFAGGEDGQACMVEAYVEKVAQGKGISCRPKAFPLSRGWLQPAHPCVEEVNDRGVGQVIENGLAGCLTLAQGSRSVRRKV